MSATRLTPGTSAAVTIVKSFQGMSGLEIDAADAGRAARAPDVRRRASPAGRSRPRTCAWPVTFARPSRRGGPTSGPDETASHCRLLIAEVVLSAGVARTSPRSKPRRNQLTRCSDDPCVKRSGATARRLMRWIRSSPIAAAAFSPSSTSPVSSSPCRARRVRAARLRAPTRRQSNRPAAPAAPTARSADPGAPDCSWRTCDSVPSRSARDGRARARARRPARSRLAP